MNIIRPGSKVSFKYGDKLKGIVISAIISEGVSLQYQVAWWNGRQRFCENVMWYEIEVVDYQTDSYIPIGFVGDTNE